MKVWRLTVEAPHAQPLIFLYRSRELCVEALKQNGWVTFPHSIHWLTVHSEVYPPRGKKPSPSEN